LSKDEHRLWRQLNPKQYPILQDLSSEKEQNNKIGGCANTAMKSVPSRDSVDGKVQMVYLSQF
jgi:hypothetical protein